MALTVGGDFELPIEYMTHIPDKKSRRKYFDSLLEFYKTEFPGFKLIYAYLAPLDKIMKGFVDYWNADITNTFAAKTDYVLIFEVESKIEGKPVYVIENPLFATDRSTVGFQYCKEKGILDKYKNVVLETATRIPVDKFYEFVYQMAYAELKEGYPTRLTDSKMAKFYETLPRIIKSSLANDVDADDEVMVLDPNAKPFTGVLTLDKYFWKSKDNLEALLSNLIILSSYYTKPQK